ncbi:hypothetical protein WJX72_004495 [[Myrmecia] bisecta]|uniref:ER membrane protein complex subunit 10 n=1 Tax=[Myrmecia] bisecta TaxID=41462 RepID=A0AAW1R5Z8_9CHLO
MPLNSVLTTSSYAQIVVEHAFGDDVFTPAGELVLQGPADGPLTFIREALTTQHKQAFTKLLAQDGFYKLRLPSKAEASDSPKVLASVRARCLASDQFQEQLSLHVNEHAQVIAADYSTASGVCRPGLQAPTPPSDWQFPADAKVDVVQPVAAPVLTMTRAFPMDPLNPGMAQSANGPGQGVPGADGKAAGQGDKPKVDERSWLARNWMFLVPVALVLLQLMAAPEPTATQRQAAGRAAGAGGAGAGASVARGAARPAVTAGPKRR